MKNSQNGSLNTDIIDTTDLDGLSHVVEAYSYRAQKVIKANHLLHKHGIHALFV